MKKPENDVEKAVQIVQHATGDAAQICAAKVDALSGVEITCLAHAFDDGRSVNFAHEVLNYVATRERMETIAAERIAKQVAEAQSEDETVLA